MARRAAQEQGPLGRVVGAMIRRTVRARFRNVYWRPPASLPAPPLIFAANHHGWHDGYLMFHLVTALGVESVLWVEEFDAFPLFSRIGALPYPKGDANGRAATVRRTIRLMREQGCSLVLFPEGDLHPGPDLLPFQRALSTVAQHTGASVVPVAIRYAMGSHERPEAFIEVGASVSASEARAAVEALLRRSDANPYDLLVRGTPDVNERWGLNRKGRRS